MRRGLLAVDALTAGIFWQVLLQGYHLPSGEGDMAVFINVRNSFSCRPDSRRFVTALAAASIRWRALSCTKRSLPKDSRRTGDSRPKPQRTQAVRH